MLVDPDDIRDDVDDPGTIASRRVLTSPPSVARKKRSSSLCALWTRSRRRSTWWYRSRSSRARSRSAVGDAQSLRAPYTFVDGALRAGRRRAGPWSDGAARARWLRSALPIAAGIEGTVTMENVDDAAHTLTAVDKGFDTGTLAGKASGSVTAPDAPGTYEYICSIHNYMKGALRVAA